MKRIAILGLGASGMFAVMACNEYGIEPVVISDKKPSPPAGAFYYHWVPNSYSQRIVAYPIRYRYVGNERGYLEKQWINNKALTSSFGKYPEGQRFTGYSPAEINKVFAHKSAFLFKEDRVTANEAVKLCKEYDYVISTFPMSKFVEYPKALKRPVLTYPDKSARNLIIYNGQKNPKWVRLSILFGHMYLEYGDTIDLPRNYDENKLSFVPDIIPSTGKKLVTDPKPDNLHFMGRFAENNRSILAHEAYAKMEKLLNAK